MSAELNIVTQSDLRAFLDGHLGLQGQADVIAVLSADDRAVSLLKTELRRRESQGETKPSSQNATALETNHGT